MTEKQGNTEPNMTGENERKPRKRIKKLCKQLREQMEFYFSDANLQKDRFLKQQMDISGDGYLLLELFLKFNKIASLTTDINIIARALSSSKLLEVTSTGDRVRRMTPLKEPTDVDERTIYVECLPLEVDHDWLHQVFGEYGKVVYTSLPRYKTSGDKKGFAFVEFETVQGAEKACQALQHPVKGRFPKANKQKLALQKQASAKDPDAAWLENEQKPLYKCTKRTRHTSEDSADKGSQMHGDSGPDGTGKRKCDQQEDEANNKDTDGTGKRKCDQQEDEANNKNTDGTGKRKCDQQEEGANNKNTDGTGKRKCDQQEEGSNKKARHDDITEQPPVKKAPSENKRKRNRANKLVDKSSEQHELKVIPKLEWQQLKKEYLTQQKASMQELKRNLYHNRQNQQLKGQKCRTKTQKSHIEFSPNVIVKVTCTNVCARKEIQETASLVAKVAYVDILEGNTEGHIRCEDARSAARLSAASHQGMEYQLLQGEQEKNYWDKINADREKKLQGKSHKRKGSQKLLERVDKSNGQHMKQKHVFFQ